MSVSQPKGRWCKPDAKAKRLFLQTPQCQCIYQSKLVSLRASTFHVGALGILRLDNIWMA